jgi:hypothetical protein
MKRSFISTAITLLRDASILKVFGCLLIISAVFVALWLPSRWNGGGGITEWFLPLRSITADEAAFLIRQGEASIMSIDADYVMIGSRYFVIVYQDTPRRDGTPVSRMYDAQATFDDYYSAYSVYLPALEASLGRALTEYDIHPEAFKEYQLSFSPEHLPFYLLFETTLLAILATFIVYSLRHIRSRWQAIHSFTVAQLILLLVVPFYAPAFVDADYFYQRIALETIWNWTIAIFPFSLIASVFCIVGHMWSIMRKSRAVSG